MVDSNAMMTDILITIKAFCLSLLTGNLGTFHRDAMHGKAVSRYSVNCYFHISISRFPKNTG